MASFLGYRGELRGPVFCGWGRNGGMVRVSGNLASEISRLPRPTAAHCTRADVAITVFYDTDTPGRARLARDGILAAYASGEVSRRIRMTYIDGCGDGDTLYVGSRTSEVFGRIYDKWRESRDPYYACAWRWEIEFKGGRAESLLRMLDGASDRTGVLIGVSRCFWRGRGVLFPPVEKDAADLRVVSVPVPDDPARTLAWLATDVRPAVGALLEYFEQDAILWALGLSGEGGEPPDGSSK